MEDSVSFSINPTISFKSYCNINSFMAGIVFSFKQGDSCSVKQFSIRRNKTTDYDTIQILAHLVTDQGEGLVPISYFNEMSVVEMRAKFLNQTFYLIMDNVPLIQEEAELIEKEFEVGIKEIKQLLLKIA